MLHLIRIGSEKASMAVFLQGYAKTLTLIYITSFADKALKAVFDVLLKSTLCSKIFDVYRKILSYPTAVAPLRDLVSVQYVLTVRCCV